MLVLVLVLGRWSEMRIGMGREEAVFVVVIRIVAVEVVVSVPASIDPPVVRYQNAPIHYDRHENHIRHRTDKDTAVPSSSVPQVFLTRRRLLL